MVVMPKPTLIELCCSPLLMSYIRAPDDPPEPVLFSVTPFFYLYIHIDAAGKRAAARLILCG
jgi:hypothetical protein